VTDAHRGRTILILVAVIGLAVAAVVVGLVLLLRDDPAAAPDTPGRQPLEGFGDAAVVVESPDGDEVDYCLLLADTPERRKRGLMEVTDADLGGYDGMLFRFEDEVASAFWMMNTPMPLTVAYIGSDGELVSTADMEPCVGDDDIAAGCPTYPPDGPYRWAVEVPQGGLPDIGLVAGARFTDTGEPCPD
jgi:uncharacterized membrane protein (UPF0127 family)